jgi:hypothetical protein
MDLMGVAIFHKQTSSQSKHKNREEQALICTIASSHFYGIKNKEIGDKICKSVTHKHLSIQGSNIIERAIHKPHNKKRIYLEEIPESFAADTNYYINTEKLNDLYYKFINEGISSIVNQACEDFKLDFENQTLRNLARQLFDEHIENNKYK